jgi:transcriptional regulator with XRE-family HTH domain
MLRKEKKITQAQLADRLSVTKSVVSYYELHERTPSPEILIKLAAIFHVSTDYLLGLDKKESVDLSGLDQNDVMTVKHLIATLRSKNQKSK